MNTALYRVEFLPTEQKIVDTTEFNYGKNLETNYYDHFLEVYGSIMDKINIPVDFLVSVNNQIYTSGGDYLQNLNACIKGDFIDIFKLTQNPQHLGFYIPLDLLDEFLQSFDEENQFIWFDNGTILWEYFYEKVRQEEFNHLPSRYASTFFFDTLENCNYFLTSHRDGIGQARNVELLETEKVFKGDMNIMDTINNSISRDQLMELIRQYWKGEKSGDPIIETVFQGKFQFTN
ncbi:hypothetical protein C3K47_10530 [Solitalea longa]|uniref:Uncharacterized protein n=1 Tax=Solitalea longa TaxID=2079460 RepID=A0A2S5A2H4_9SPHI|nr:DUF2441 domain-containing protein [Solitalea longa]POY36781.1 hypothetical protein C3K47_10530 [Solitalea longa]